MYTIKSIEKEAEVEGKFGTQIRTSFHVDGNDKSISAFSKYPLKVGQEIEGDIVPNGEWLNFKFTPKTHETRASHSFQPTGDLLRIERKLDALMTEIQMVRGLMQGTKKQEQDVDSDCYPTEDAPF
jgi:hypothetical protein